MINRFLRAAPKRCLLAILIAGNLLALLQMAPLWPLTITIFIMLPGYVALSHLQLGATGRLVRLMLCAGIGLTALMFLGLAVNSLHWIAGIERPLSAGWMLLAINIFVLAMLGLMSWRRQPPLVLPRVSREHHFNPVIIGVGLLGLALLLAAYFGVNRLNNTGDSRLVEYITGVVCAAPLLVMALRRRLTASHYALILYFMSCLLLFSSSFRSAGLFGSDIINEFSIFELTERAGFWSIEHLSNTYNLCLSITVLPQVLSVLTGQDGLYVFKSMLHFIFSICPIVIFLIARRYVDAPKAFLAAVVFMGFENYIGSMPNHIRQEMAFLFFALMILVFLSREIPRRVRSLLFLLLGLSMVVSHYSTSYVAMLLLLSYLAITLALRYIPISRLRSLKPNPLSPSVLFALLVFTVSWYSLLTPTSGGPVSYLQSVVNNLLYSHENLQASHTALSSQFNLINDNSAERAAFDDYKETENPGYDIQYVAPPLSENGLDKALNDVLVTGVGLIKKAYKVLMLTAIAIILFIGVYRKRRDLDDGLLVWVASCAATIALSFIIPSFSVEYDQERFFQQLLIVLAPAVVIAWFWLWRGKTLAPTYLLGGFLALYLAVSTDLSSQFIGGFQLSGKFNNNAMDYSRYYLHASELKASEWSIANRGYRGIFADAYAGNRLKLISPTFYPQETIMPTRVREQSLIYFGYANSVERHTFISHQGKVIIVSSPTDYYERQANKPYVNSRSSIYAY